MPSTLPAIVSPRPGLGAPELTLPDDRGLSFSGLAPVPNALRGALFEASNGRSSPTALLAAAVPPPGSPSRPINSITTQALLSAPLQVPHRSGSTPGPGPSSLVYSALASVGGAGASPGAPSVAWAPPPQQAPEGLAPASAALRAAAEGVAEALDAAVRASEAQNRALLSATRESVGLPPAPSGAGGGGGPARPASARALDRALSASRLKGLSGGRGMGWVRSIVRQTEGGQAYTAAAEEAERERAGEGGESGGGGPKRGPLPSLRQAPRPQDAVQLQAWLADTLQQVAAAAAARQQAQHAEHAQHAPQLQQQPDPEATAAVGGPDPGGQAHQAAELADAALYVVGVALEELRRQVAAECKERGDVLGSLVEQQAGLLALRGALAAEGRAAEASGQWAAVVAEGQKDAAPTSASGPAPGSYAPGLAAQLVAAQHAAAAAERRYALADAALSGEVARRTAAEQQLEAARELLKRQEDDWLRNRSTAQRLEAERAGMVDRIEEARREAAVAEARASAARQETHIGKDEVAELEAALARMRQQYEGNEILVVAQRQQVRELEAALAALREQHREQAVALGKVGKVTEQYETAAADLRSELAAEQARAADLAAALAVRTARLTEVEESLAATEAALETVRTALARSEDAFGKATSEADAAQRRLQHELADALAARRQEETRREQLEREAAAQCELVKLVARTLALQGMEGVPSLNDKTWDSGGPLGAAQRVLGLVTQQLAMLYGHQEDLARQLRGVQAKLLEEKEAATKLQKELYESRTAEARMIKEKEVVDMRLAALEHDLRHSQAEALKYRAAVVDTEARIKVQHETIMQLQAQIKELPPLKRRVEALHIDLEATKKAEEEGRQALDVTRKNLEVSETHVEWYKKEVERLQGEVAELQTDVKQMRTVQAKLGEEEARAKELEEQVVGLQYQLDLTAESHSETLKQLDLAKFFLQGLESNGGAPPGSAGAGNRPSTSASSPGRPVVSPSRPSATSPTSRYGSPGSRSRSGRVDILVIDEDEAFGEGQGDDLSPGLEAVSRTSPGGATAAAAAAAASGSRPASAVPTRPYSAFNRVGPGASAPPRSRAGSARSMAAAAAGGLSAGASAGSVAGGAAGVRSVHGGKSRPGSALRAGSRPGSAFSQAPPIDEEDSIYQADVPEEVLAIMRSRGLASRPSANAKWFGIKIAIMSWFSNKLRARLTEAVEQLATKDLEIANLHVAYLTEMKQREQFISEELVSTLTPVLESAMSDTQREVTDLRSHLPGFRQGMDALAASTAVLALSLKGYRERESHAVSRSAQTDAEGSDDWLRYAASLPPLPPGLALSVASLTETIVRIYLRAGMTVEDVPTWGPPRHDTIHDAIMAHYTSQRAPGSFSSDLITDPESPVARLLGSAALAAKNTKVACFLYFLGLSPEGVHWPSPTWHFFLALLHCLRVLLSGTWRVVTKKWATPEGVQIPMPAAMDLVGNIFNVQAPADLDGAMSVRLASIVTPGAAGPAVDLDALLLLLVREHSAGNCPRAPLLFPRRLTDGALFNVFNAAGHNAHIDVLRSHTADRYIGATAPPSPAAGARRGPASVSAGATSASASAAASPSRQYTPTTASLAASAAGLSRPGTVAGGLSPSTPHGRGPSLASNTMSTAFTYTPPSTAGGPVAPGDHHDGGGTADFLHPYGDLGLDSAGGSGSFFAGGGESGPLPSGPSSGSVGGRDRERSQLLEPLQQRLARQQLQAQLERVGAGGGGGAGGWGGGEEGMGMGSVGGGPPEQPAGSTTVSFEISHRSRQASTSVSVGGSPGAGGGGGGGGQSGSGHAAGAGGGKRLTALPSPVRRR
ncbi:hypothetical protein HYH03_006168 [Edaphochlamys debaryana]|uniref:Uncharacterized protein n=1 Tax=Edaphochlamys debaryana TaxID=47281 RepID=A0A836C1F8_9CHLO|nr:hypothetical protein HYH03_006168 [Edaphochlamys debaryana]|eukprot:KAG2495568.1 hypothetical protein HYH03_006168 [Edaphochlamys debaryana]